MENVQWPEDTRAGLVNRLVYLRDILRWIDSRWQDKIAIEQRYQALAPTKRKWGFLPFALWAAGLTILLTKIATPLLQSRAKADAYAQGKIYYPNIQEINVGILAIPVAVLLTFLILLFRNKLILPKHNARIEVLNQQRDTHNEAVWAEEQRVNDQLNQAARDLAAHRGNSFPQAYLYDDAVAFCVEAVNNHRASSVEAAINLYEEARHRQRVEDAQADMLAEQQKMRKLQAVSAVIGGIQQGAAIGAIRQQGAQTRAANSADNNRLIDAINKPRTVTFKRR